MAHSKHSRFRPLVSAAYDMDYGSIDFFGIPSFFIGPLFFRFSVERYQPSIAPYLSIQVLSRSRFCFWVLVPLIFSSTGYGMPLYFINRSSLSFPKAYSLTGSAPPFTAPGRKALIARRGRASRAACRIWKLLYVFPPMVLKFIQKGGHVQGLSVPQPPWPGR
jgi:hypothetical protein